MKQKSCCTVDSKGTAVLTEGAGCSCCSEHGRTHNDEHEPSREHGEEGGLPLEGCGCGHCHGEGGGELGVRRVVLSILGSAALAAVALFLLEGPLQAVLMIAAILLVGWPILLQGIKAIFRLRLEEMALMTIAVVAACLIGEYFEALLVTLLFRVGEMLEELAVARSRREVEAITRIIPENANRLAPDGASQLVRAGDLIIGDRILIKSGERVPVDCRVLSGQSSVDTSSLTGESAPREVEAGDSLLSGMVNAGGVLICETISTLDRSAASKIVEMVRESAAKKGRTERLISKFARVYTPTVVLLAVLVAAVPPLLGLGDFTDWLSRSLVFLVASCPCALVIATPLSFFAGIGACSKNGILVKGSRYLEALSKADGVVMDKTGTLTTGSLSVAGVTPAAGESPEEVLRLAATCEQYSNHPIARAIVAAAGQAPQEGESCEEITSHGMKVKLEGRELLCGSARLMDKFGVDISGLPDSAVYLARDGVALGAIEAFDRPRQDAAQMVKDLGELGVSQVVMLTGDSRGPAEKTADLVGIRRVEAELLPEDKVTALEQVKDAANGTVLFLGDGINDSPVIARADAGIAMGMGSDAAIEAADVVLLGERLSALPQAIRIARRTGRLARVNIAFALIVKLSVFALALTGNATMWMAVFADVGVTVLSVLNATRALRFR